MESEVKSNSTPLPSNSMTSRALTRLGGRGREPLSVSGIGRSLSNHWRSPELPNGRGLVGASQTRIGASRARVVSGLFRGPNQAQGALVGQSLI